MTTSTPPPPENDPSKKIPSPEPSNREKPRRVGPVQCEVCGKPATHHCPPPTLWAMCDTCSPFDARYVVVGLLALVASTPSLLPLAFWMLLFGGGAAVIIRSWTWDGTVKKSPPPHRRAGTR